jgi:hypothetical protein
MGMSGHKVTWLLKAIGMNNYKQETIPTFFKMINL